MMLQAASIEGVLPRQLSFKQTLQLCMASRQHLAHLEEATGDLLHLIAKRRVGQRLAASNRARSSEGPPFPLLTKHRQLAREELRLHGHP